MSDTIQSCQTDAVELSGVIKALDILNGEDSNNGRHAISSLISIANHMVEKLEGDLDRLDPKGNPKAELTFAVSKLSDQAAQQILDRLNAKGQTAQ